MHTFVIFIGKNPYILFFTLHISAVLGVDLPHEILAKYINTYSFLVYIYYVMF